MANPGRELASLDFGNLIGGPLVAVIKAQSLAADATTKFIKDNGFYAEGAMAADGTTPIEGTPIYVDFKYPKEVVPYIPAIGTPGDTFLLPYVEQGKPAVTGINITGIDSTRKILTGTNFNPLWVGRTVTTTAGLINTGTKIVSVTPAGTSMTIDNAILGNSTIFTIGLDAEDIGLSAFPDGRPAYVAPVPAQYQEMTISVPILTMLPIPFIKVDIITIDFNAKINSMETASTSTEAAVSGTLNARYGGRFTPASVSFSGSASFKKSTTSGASVERTYSMAIHVQASQDEMPAGMEKLLNLLEGAMISKPGAITSGS